MAAPSIVKPEGAENRVFTADDLDGVEPMRAPSKLPGYKPADFPALATTKVRFVGETVAACVGATRAEAEDLAQMVEVDYEELDPAIDMLEARKPGAPLVHDFVGRQHRADHPRRRRHGLGQGARGAFGDPRVPHESAGDGPDGGPRGAGGVEFADGPADRPHRDPVPHLIRAGLAMFLGLEQRQVRVIAPDVGGGFGLKTYVQPEELVACWYAMKYGRPARWISDRREHLIADANCREHHYIVTAHADAEGKILGLEGEVTVDAGAYSIYPFTNCLEAAMAGGNLPGPYAIEAYGVKTWTVVTNKPPLVPYRGVARPGVAFAMEMLVDAVARAVGREPHEVRTINMVPASAMPYTNIARKTFDSGDHAGAVAKAVQMIDIEAVRERQARGEPDGRLIGLGFGSYVEQAAHGTSVFASWGVQMVPGYEQAGAKLTPDGGLELRVGVQSHGQGMETTLAQVASEVLGIDPENVSVIHGDTGLTPYSTGTYASRSIVMAGGAVSRACKVLVERMKTIGAHLLQCEPDEVRVADGRVMGPGGDLPLSEIGRVWYINPERAPGRRRYRRRRGGGRLPPGARSRHVFLLDPAAGRRGRSRNGGSRGARLRRGRGLRNHGQPDGGLGPGLWRRGAGHRNGAVRGIAVRRARPAAGLDLRRLPPAGRGRGAVLPPRAHGHALAPHRARHQGHGRRQHHPDPGGDRKRGQRCAPRLRAEVNETPISPRRVLAAITASQGEAA